MQLSVLGLWKDKGQAKCIGWGQLGACQASGTSSPPNTARHSTGMEARGGRSLTLHLQAALAKVPAQTHLELKRTGKVSPAAHVAAVAPWLRAGEESIVLSR